MSTEIDNTMIWAQVIPFDYIGQIKLLELPTNHAQRTWTYASMASSKSQDPPSLHKRLTTYLICSRRT